jgi:SAM-dependent methyltransferase
MPMTTAAMGTAPRPAVGQREGGPPGLDEFTISQLACLGVEPGWHCLHIGAEAEAITGWLAERVGHGGRVLVTAGDTTALAAPASNVSVCRVEVGSDELPGGDFDLVCAAGVLGALPPTARRSVLGRMVAALRHGGHLLLGELDRTGMPVLTAPSYAARVLFERFEQGLCRLLSRAGADAAWGAHAYHALAERGLIDLGYTAAAGAWPGGGAGCEWLSGLTRQHQNRLTSAGLFTTAELDALRELLANPAFAVRSHLATAAWGRRPRERD